MTGVAFPWAIGEDGRTATVDRTRHVRDLIELVVLTSIGERVNRPTFGSGLLQAVFGPAGDEAAATAQVLVQSSLHEWLGDVIEVEGVAIDHADARLTVTIQYLIRADQERRIDAFVREV